MEKVEKEPERVRIQAYKDLYEHHDVEASLTLYNHSRSTIILRLNHLDARRIISWIQDRIEAYGS